MIRAMDTLLTPLVSKKRMKSYSHIECLKRVLILLFWQFATGLIYNLLMTPVAYLRLYVTDIAVLATGLMALMLLVLSPVASFMADVKFTRFKTLLGSTYCTFITSIPICLMFMMAYNISTFNSFIYILLVLFSILLLLYFCGRIFFLANVLQFGTDQLRDAPTRYSVLFIYAYYWCDTVSTVLTRSTNIPGHEIIVSQRRDIINFDKLKVSLYILVILTSTFLSAVILVTLYKKKTIFNIEGTGRNPYKLTWSVIKFALQHDKPLKRSAFTFCENVIPSKLDFGKRRYGGPFTTEQVEDVKVLLNLVKLFFSLGPVLFMDISATFAVNHHISYNKTEFVKDPWKDFFVYNEVLSPLMASIWTVMLYKLTNLKWFPNIFKRIGISILLLNAIFGVYLIKDLLSNNIDTRHEIVICNDVDTFTELPHLDTFSFSFVVILHSILYSFYHTLLNTSVWELICCQSPQFMKGLVFGIFFSVQALFRFFALVALYTIIYFWKSKLRRCNFFIYIMNLCIGLLVFVVYTILARKYQYRKRDDICNIYQYAEDYYSREHNKLTVA